MKINKYFELIEQKTSLAPIIVAVLLIISIGTSYVSKFFAWGQKGLFLYLQQNLHWLWLFALTLIVATLFIWTHRLYKQLVYGFSDQFKRDLSQNWNFKGPWRIAENGTLFVTGSDAGGITKTGAQWENYTFSFKARIMKDCLGVIVRAQDLSNYYMFQIRTDKIRPHRRVAIPDIEHKEGRTDEESRSLTIKGFNVGWEKYESLKVPIIPPLSDWFDTKITVRGESVYIYINDELIFQEESFLKIPVGKVGFRNDGKELAKVRNVKVRIER